MDVNKYVLLSFLFSVILLTISPHYTCAQHFKNSVGITFVYITGGEFIMGDKGKYGESDEKPVHKVILAPFFLSETEVTSAQWKVFCDNSDTEWDRWEDVTKYSPSKEYPIVFVSWEDAFAFCQWLGEKEGRIYRLPTEAEWEYAARGGLQCKVYPWGDDPISGTECNFADKREYLKEKDSWAAETLIDDGYAYCAASKYYPPNRYGLYQMAGNVLEWCNDWYYSHYYRETESDNPKGPSSGREKVLRGGAWCFPPQMLRVSDRYSLNPKTGKEFIGFRIATDIKSTEPEKESVTNER